MSPRRSAGRVPPPSREREHHPSFSAALLDAIYHSLDADACAPADELRRANVSPCEMPSPPPSRHRRPSTASSPSVSSARSPRPPKPPRPCRVLPHPQAPSLLLPPLPPISMPAPPAVESKENRKTRRKKRSKFACLLNALLCNRKPPTRSSSVDATATATRPLPPTVAVEPASARSILSSRASRRDSAAAAGGFLTPGRRAVRFSPAVEVVVDEEEHDHGARTTGRLRDASGSGTESSAAADAERRVEELLRALSVAEERERAKESSESSSDLFELESLPPALDNAELPRTTVAAAGLAPPRRRVLLDEMVV